MKYFSLNQKYIQQPLLFRLLAPLGGVTILDILRNGQEFVCQKEAALRHLQVYISQTLSVSRQAEILAITRHERNEFYRTINFVIFQIVDAVKQSLVSWLEIIKRLPTSDLPKYSERGNFLNNDMQNIAYIFKQ